MNENKFGIFKSLDLMHIMFFGSLIPRVHSLSYLSYQCVYVPFFFKEYPLFHNSAISTLFFFLF